MVEGKKGARVFKLLPEVTYAVSAHTSLAEAIKSNFSEAKKRSPPSREGSVCWYNYPPLNLYPSVHLNQERELHLLSA